MLPGEPSKIRVAQPLQLLSPLPQQMLYPHDVSLADRPVLLQAVPRVRLYAAAAGLLLL
jgi:hypothetical protein